MARVLARSVACLALGLVYLGAACSREAAPRNLVLVTIDTLRADHMGLYGYGRSTTPFIERQPPRILDGGRSRDKPGNGDVTPEVGP